MEFLKAPGLLIKKSPSVLKTERLENIKPLGIQLSIDIELLAYTSLGLPQK
jgi:hypothetical protein